MINPLKILKWRIYGNYDLEGPVRENNDIRAKNRAKYEVWKYNTFGPGRVIYRKELAYQFVDAPELTNEPLNIHNPEYIMAMACIIAEMEGHKTIAMLTPIGAHKTIDDITREEDNAINRIVNYLVPNDLKPREHIERYEKSDMINLFGDQVFIPIKRTIIPDIPAYRKEHYKHFHNMLEKLKQYQKERILF